MCSNNSIDSCNKILLENEVEKIVYPNQTKNIGHKESKDIVIAGFGWINVRTTHGCKDIKIFSPKIEGILLRDSLMQYIT